VNHMPKKRDAVPEELVQQVLLNSKRRCCLCHDVGNDEVREGQIGHVVGADKAGAETEDNLVFLCLDHHRQLDAGKLSADEVRQARTQLYQWLSQPPSDKGTDAPWEKYEKHVYSLFRRALERAGPSIVTVHLNRMYPGKSGCLRELDISANANLGGLRILIAVNVKYSKAMVSTQPIEGFAGLLDDVGANKGLFVSNGGFTKEARRVANWRGIALATVKEDAAELSPASIIDLPIGLDRKEGE
jgi:hypothetical protein